MLGEAGVPGEEIRVVRTCDMRYLGQGHEINVPVPLGKLDEEQIVRLRENFEERYKKIYHRLNPNLPVQCLNWRITVSGKNPGFRVKGDQAGSLPLGEAIKGEREVYSPDRSRYVVCPVYDRYRLSPGVELRGPAVIEETESTIVVGARGQVRVNENLCVIIHMDDGSQV